MRGRSRNQNELPLEKPVRVRLSDTARSDKAHRLAVVGQAIRAHRREMAARDSGTKEAIKKLEAERAELEDALVADEELKAQGQLFVSDVSPVEAKGVLAAVAEKAGEPKPSEPHPFEPASASVTGRHVCKTCGAGKEDPIHQPSAAAGNGKGAAPAPRKGDSPKASTHPRAQR